ncbi:TPA: isopeptide-forming domain-containing fimbrial protein [Streptococcus suis]
MRKLRLFIATVVAVFSAFTGSVAFAADSYTITINNPVSGHTYEAYQIFTGDLSADGTLSNIMWGNNVSEEGKVALGNAMEVAEKLSKSTNNSTEAKNFATKVNTYLTASATGTGTTAITGLAAGYYLIKDKNDETSAYILGVVKDITITPKVGVPTVDKKVKDTNDTTGTTTDWQDSADYDINDKVPYKLTATLPANYDSFNSYYLNFVDELSVGLTYNNDAKVYVVNNGVRTEVTNYFYAGQDNGKLSFAIADLKQIGVDGTADITKDSQIVVEYTATLNDKAVIGSAGNPNTVVLKYSNNPNNSGDGNQKPNTPPPTPPTPPTTPPGETPGDKVIVFTYEFNVNKVDEKTNPLKGAAFTLYKKFNNEWKEVKAFVAGDQTTFSFTGLDDGEYKLSETVAPSGYNKISDIIFTISAEHEANATEPRLLSLTTVQLETTSKDGKLSANVVNKKGSILPSTGSVGTTLFYTFGSLFAIVAMVLLITKKRIDSE